MREGQEGKYRGQGRADEGRLGRNGRPAGGIGERKWIDGKRESEIRYERGRG